MFRSPSEVRVTSRQISKWGHIPNTSIQSKPLLIYHGAFNASPSELKSQFESVGKVEPQWVYGMFPQSHFHSTTHEVLGVVSGSARLCFGGEGNPDRFEPTVKNGDLMIVPAGVSHRLLDELESFKMVGAYPKDKEWDMCYGKQEEEEKVKGVEKVNWFHQDPLFGADGPALHV